MNLSLLNISPDTPAITPYIYLSINLSIYQKLYYPTFCPSAAAVRAEDEVDVDGTVEEDLGKSRDGSRTDDEVVQR